ncbi:hypothetical protein [Aurantiacibacter zhengii]|uniref:hypothetical protein n=1 Tax=Aurantiacibacter zhengii TaxID=2307003 RepID=UPI0011C23C7C|nr:hypothetical protein [Aurantiacibacter zhengii]
MNPTKKKLDSAVKIFDDRAYEIVKEFQRSPKKGPTPFESRWGSFKRQAYRLIRNTKSSQGGHKVIKSIVRSEDRIPAYLLYKGNEFHWGLLAIDPHGVVLDAKRLSLISRQLKYADNHDVPAHYLVGFLYQSGASTSTAKKLALGACEPWRPK